ncbi:MAG: HIT family protein [Bdellovibrionales bacterium]
MKKTKKTKLKAKTPAKPAAKEWALKIVKDVWPTERDFFERPERFRYVRKLLPENKDCVFCEAAKAKPSFESLVLVKDENCVIVMNKYPYNSGHLLITPVKHIGNLWELDDDINAALAGWMKKSTAILKEVTGCQGFNLGLNQGKVAGAGIPDHLHWHVIPRWGGDTNFFPLIAETKVLPETLEQTYSRLQAHFQPKDRK